MSLVQIELTGVLAGRYRSIRSEGGSLLIDAGRPSERAVTVAADEWRSFWSAVDALGAWAWRESYDPGIMDGVTPGLIIGAATEIVAGEGRILTAGGIDAHVHFISPNQINYQDQVNALLPRSLAGRGEVEITLMADGMTANTVRASIR